MHARRQEQIKVVAVSKLLTQNLIPEVTFLAKKLATDFSSLFKLPNSEFNASG